MPIVLRLAKGRQLTFAELDGNFTDLDGRLDTVEGFNLNTRVARLETAGTPFYFDSDDVNVMIDSIWGGTNTSYLATTDSIGLASFDSQRFTVTDGHVSWIERLATKDSDGTASFDSQDFVVLNGRVSINPTSPGGRVAGNVEIDSTGVASFNSDDFNVNTNGHVSLTDSAVLTRITDSAVRTRISATDNGGAGSFTYNQTSGTFIYTGAPDASTSTKGIASFNSADFTVSSGVVSLANAGFSTTFGSVGSMAFLQTHNIPNGQGVAVGATVAGSKLLYGAPPGSNIASFGYNSSTGAMQGPGGGKYNTNGLGGQQASGTWRNMGPGVADYSATAEFLNLWVRVS